MTTLSIVATFNSFLTGLENLVENSCCSAQAAHKPVQQSRQQAQRAYSPNAYTVVCAIELEIEL